MNGQPRSNLARLLPNGDVEDPSTFNMGTGPGGYVSSIALQPDGKILIGGNFGVVNGQPRRYIARLLPDGILESTATFNPGSGPDYEVTTIALQPDGQILICGYFETVNGQSRPRMARLASNGTLDPTFGYG